MEPKEKALLVAVMMTERAIEGHQTDAGISDSIRKSKLSQTG